MKTLKKSNLGILVVTSHDSVSETTIPKHVARARGLGFRVARLTLQDLTGRSWPAQLHVRADHRLQMARGWLARVSTNEISPGDAIVFEFVKRGAMQLHIFRGNVLLTAPHVSN
ncbi:hypothetical protein DVH24_012812 [Malus domestica]|uniref:TF-B3 domain-containing protein n=1 Tax=Malus domestica TaxID=3750 RepID=A0A498HNL2_MALDO|nr:hypothetical protein DVH24_012812 [Malus domestica]